jgi:hypothetical protein
VRLAARNDDVAAVSVVRDPSGTGDALDLGGFHGLEPARDADSQFRACEVRAFRARNRTDTQPSGSADAKPFAKAHELISLSVQSAIEAAEQSLLNQSLRLAA